MGEDEAAPCGVPSGRRDRGRGRLRCREDKTGRLSSVAALTPGGGLTITRPSAARLSPPSFFYAKRRFRQQGAPPQDKGLWLIPLPPRRRRARLRAGPWSTRIAVRACAALCAKSKKPSKLAISRVLRPR